MKNLVLMAAVLLSGCATIANKEMQAAQVLIASEAQSAESLICKMLPIGTWMVMYGSSPARADGWAKICNPPTVAPAVPLGGVTPQVLP